VPGIDGKPPELILNFWDDLGPVTLQSLNIAIEKGQFHRDINRRCYIPKKEKDLTNCATFSANQLTWSRNEDVCQSSSHEEEVINKRVHPDQTGFIKGRQAADNMLHPFRVVAEASYLDTPCAVLSF
jgi:hypothetical protein